MKYTELNPDEIFDIVNMFVTEPEFKEYLDSINVSMKDGFEFFEDTFYMLMREQGYSFRGMKKEDIGIIKNMVKLFYKTSIHLELSK